MYIIMNIDTYVYMKIDMNINIKIHMANIHQDEVSISEGRESRSRLGLETEGTETLGLVSVSYKILELVSSRSRLG